jgi:cytoskeletal protein RodZ
VGKLGDTLRDRRIALGLTIEQVQDGTRIRAKLIEALEEGQYDRLPNPGYVRGYVSSYARFLELDAVPLLNMYKAETGAGRTHELNLLPQTSEAVAPTGQQHAVPWRAAAGIALVIAVLALAVWGVASLWSEPEPTAPEPATVTEGEQTPTTEATETTEPAPEPEPEPEPEVTEQPFTLEVVVAETGASWLRVTVDDKPAYEGTLAGGQNMTFEVATEATVRIGKPEAVTVLRDGKAVQIEDDGNIGVVTLSATPTAQ